MNVGLFRPGGIGDVILMLPVLQAIREQFPDWHVHLWGQMDTGVALMWGGYVDTTADHMHGLRFFGRFPELFIGFEWNPHALGEAAMAHGCKMVATANWIAARGTHQSEHHFVEVNKALLHYLGVELTGYDKKRSYDFPVPNLFRAKNREWEDAVFIHHGTSMKAKLWKWDRLMDVAQILRGQGHQVVFLESPGDNYGDTEDFPVLTRPYLDVVYLLSRARALISVDTGNAHLAGALGIPTVTIFGPTQPECWGAIGPRVKIVQPCDFMRNTNQVVVHSGHDCLANLTPGDVVAAVEEALAL